MDSYQQADKHTNFHISNSVKQNIVTLDVTMNDILAVKMC